MTNITMKLTIAALLGLATLSYVSALDIDSYRKGDRLPGYGDPDYCLAWELS